MRCGHAKLCLSWAVEFVIPLCNAMTGTYENDLLWFLLNIMLNAAVTAPDTSCGKWEWCSTVLHTVNPEENIFQMSKH